MQSADDSTRSFECRNHREVQLDWSGVEPAMGHRYLLLAAKNCTARSVELPAHPSIVAHRGTANFPLEFKWETPRSPLTLASGQTAYLNLHWLSNGRCERGADRITATMLGTHMTLVGCLQLGNSMDADGGSDISSEVRLGWSTKPFDQV